MFSEKEILEIAIRMEKNGEREYRKAIGEVSDPELIKSLEWMAAEEKAHADFFSALLAELGTRAESASGLELDAAFLKDLIGGSSLSLETVDFGRVKHISELLSIYIGFEKDSILFYEMIMPMMDNPATRSRVENIVTEEKEHIRKLEELLRSCRGENGSAPDCPAGV